MPSRVRSTQGRRITSVMKNSARSLGYLISDVAKEYNPVINELYNSTKDTSNDLYQSIKSFSDNRPSSNGIKKEFNETTKAIFNNFKDDLKTGNWYNTARHDKSFDAMAAFGMSEDDFNFDFDDDDWGDFDDEDTDSEGFDDDTKAVISENQKSTQQVIASVDRTGYAIASSVNQGQIQSAGMIVEASNQQTQALYNLNQKGFSAVTEAMMGLNKSISAIGQLGEPLTVHMQNSGVFFTKTTQQLDDVNAKLDQLIKNTTTGTSGASGSRGGTTFSDLISGEGMFDMSGYLDMVKENFKDDKDIIDMAKNAFKGLNLKNISPGVIMGRSFAKILLPKMFKDSMKEFNEGLKYTINDLFIKGAKKFNDSPLGWLLGDYLLPKGMFGGLKKFDNSRYEKGAIQWDGIAKKALTEVIPTTLLKIYSAITNTEERRYDYNTGRFVKVSGINSQLRDKKVRAAREAGGDLYDIVSNGISKDYNYNSPEYKRAMKETEDFFVQYVLESDDPSILARLLSPQAGSIYSNVDPKVLRRIIAAIKKNPNKIRSLNTTRFEARGKYNRDMTGGDELSMLAHTANDSQWGPGKGKVSPIMVDEFGNSIFKYMGSISNQLSLIYSAITGNKLHYVDPKSSKFIDPKKNLSSAGESKRADTDKAQNEKINNAVSDEEIDEDVFTEGEEKSFKEKFGVVKGALLDNIKEKGLFKGITSAPFLAASTMLTKLSNAMTKVIIGDPDNPESGLFGMITKKAGELFDSLHEKLKDLFDTKLKKIFTKLFGEEDENGNRKGGVFSNFINDTKSSLRGSWKAVKDEVSNSAWGKAKKMRDQRAKELEDISRENAALDLDEENARAALDGSGSGLLYFLSGGASKWSQARYDRYKQLAGSENKEVANKANKKILEYNKLRKQANKARAKSIRKDRFDQTVSMGRSGDAGFIGNTLGAIFDFVDNISATSEGMFGNLDSETISSSFGDIKEKLSKAKGNMGAGAVLGFGAGALMGSPILGAVAGTTIGYIKSSESAQNFLFGHLDENNERTGGLFGKEFSNFVEKQGLKTTGVGAALGAGAGLFLGSPILGAIVGSSVGFIKSSKGAQDFLFGRMENGERLDGGVIPKEIVDAFSKNKHLAPLLGAGAGVGALLGGPLGLAGGLAVGAGINYFNASEDFRKRLFNKDDGILAEFKSKILDNIHEHFRNTGNALKGWLKRTGRKVSDLLTKGVKGMFNLGKKGLNFLGNVGRRITGRDRAKEGEGLGDKLFGFAGNFFGNRADKRMAKNISKGYGVYNKDLKRNMTSAEIAEMMKNDPRNLSRFGFFNKGRDENLAQYEDFAGLDEAGRQKAREKLLETYRNGETRKERNRAFNQLEQLDIDSKAAKELEKEHPELGPLNKISDTVESILNTIKGGKGGEESGGKAKETVNSMFGNIQMTRNEQGELEEDTTDKETKDAIEKRENFNKSMKSIPVLTGMVGGIKGFFGKLKDKIFGDKKKKNTGLFGLLGGLFSKGKGIIGKIFNVGKGILNFFTKGGLKALLGGTGAAIAAVATVALGISGKLNWIGDLLGKLPFFKGNDTKGTLSTDNTFVVGDKQVKTDKDGNPMMDENGHFITVDGEVTSGQLESLGQRNSISANLKRNTLTRALRSGGKDFGVAGAALKNLDKKLGEHMAKHPQGKLSKIVLGGAKKAGEAFRAAKKKAPELMKKAAESGVMKTVVGYIDDGLELVAKAIKKIPLFPKNIARGFTSCIDDIGEQLIKHLPAAKTLIAKMTANGAQLIPYIGQALDIAFIVADGINAWGNAESILGITDRATIGQRCIATLIGCCNSAIPVIGGIIPNKVFVNIFMTVADKLGIDPKELTAQREKAKEEVEEYNQEHGTDLSIEEYNKKKGRAGIFTKAADNVVAWFKGNKAKKKQQSKAGKATRSAKGSGLPFFSGGASGAAATKGNKALAAANNKAVAERVEKTGSDSSVDTLITFAKNGDVKSLLAFQPVSGGDAEAKLLDGVSLNTLKYSLLPAALMAQSGRVASKQLGKMKVQDKESLFGWLGKSKEVGDVVKFADQATGASDLFALSKTGNVKDFMTYQPKSIDDNDSLGLRILKNIPATATKYALIGPTLVTGAGKAAAEGLSDIEGKAAGIGDGGRDAIIAAAKAGDVAGVWSSKSDEDADNPVGGFAKGTHIGLRLVMTPLALVTAASNAISGAVGGLPKPIQNIVTMPIEDTKLAMTGHPRALWKNGLTEPDEKTPLGGFVYGLNIGHKLVLTPIAMTTFVGKSILELLTADTKSSKINQDILDKNLPILEQLANEGHPRALWDHELELEDENDPVFGFTKAIDLSYKLYLTPRASMRWFSRKFSEIFMGDENKITHDSDVVANNNKALMKFANQGDINSLWGWEFRDDPDDPVGGFYKAMNDTQKLILTPRAAFKWLGNQLGGGGKGSNKKSEKESADHEVLVNNNIALEKFANQGDISGLWNWKFRDDPDSPVGGYYRNMNEVQKLMLTPKALVKYTGNQISEGIDSVADSVTTGWEHLKQNAAYGQQAYDSSNSFRTFLATSLSNADIPEGPLSGFFTTMLLGARLVQWPFAAMHHLGNDIGTKVTDVVADVSSSLDAYENNVIADQKLIAVGDIHGIQTREYKPDPENPIGGFAHNLYEVHKVISMARAFPKWASNKYTGVENKVSTTVGDILSAYENNVIADNNLAEQGEIGAIRDREFKPDEENPIGGIAHNMYEMHKVISMAKAFPTWAGKKYLNFKSNVSEVIAETLNAYENNVIADEKLVQAGDVWGIRDREFKPDEDNPIGGIAHNLYETHKILSMGRAAVTWGGNKLSEFMTNITEGSKGNRDLLDKTISDLMSKAKDGDISGVWGATFAPSTADPLHGVWTASFEIQKGFGIATSIITGIGKGLTGIGKTIADKFSTLKDTVANGILDVGDSLFSGTKEYTGDNEFGTGSGMISGGSSGFVSQFDANIKDKQMVGGRFADQGCGPAVAAMAANAYGIPMDVNTALDDSKAYQNQYGVSFDYFGNALGKRGIKTQFISGGSSGDIYRSIASGHPAVVMGRDVTNTSKAYSPFGPKNHYILAKGLDSNGNIIVNDPELRAPRVYDPSILDSAQFAVATSGGGSFPKIKLSKAQAKGIAGVAKHEQGDGEKGIKAEASLMANLINREKGMKVSASDAVGYITAAPGWFSPKSNPYRAQTRYNEGGTDQQAKWVMDVFNNGNRTVPLYVDEHDMIPDIVSISTGDKSNRSNYKKDKTVIHNNSGSTYTFWGWPAGENNDPFGYTEGAKKKFGNYDFKAGGDNGSDSGSSDSKDSKTETKSNPGIVGTVVNAFTSALSKALGEESGDDGSSTKKGKSSGDDISDGKASKIGKLVAKEADKHKGDPYVWGGASLGAADCSGFTMALYNKYGYSLSTAEDDRQPGISAGSGGRAYTIYNSKQKGKRIKGNDLSKMAAGDILYFVNGSGLHHTGIYMGDGTMVHAKSTKDGVVRQKIKGSKYYDELGKAGAWHITAKPNTSAAGSGLAYISGGKSGVDAIVHKDLKKWPDDKVTAESLNKWIAKEEKVRGKSPFHGQGKALMEGALKYGIDPRYIVADSIGETGMGKTGSGAPYNNFWGYGVYGGQVRYKWKSPAQALKEYPGLLNKNYYKNGQHTLYSFSNDPSGHNYNDSKSYPSYIAGFYKNAPGGLSDEGTMHKGGGKYTGGDGGTSSSSSKDNKTKSTGTFISRVTNAFSKAFEPLFGGQEEVTKSGDSSSSDTGAVNGDWISTVETVKKAVAKQHPGYSASLRDIKIGKKTYKYRPDCTGLTSLAAHVGGYMDDKHYAWPPASDAWAHSSAKELGLKGFKRMSWPGWNKLQKGDIIAINGTLPENGGYKHHAEIFSHNKGGKHYVWNGGSTDSLGTPGAEPSAKAAYQTVWRKTGSGSGLLSYDDVIRMSGGSTGTRHGRIAERATSMLNGLAANVQQRSASGSVSTEVVTTLLKAITKLLEKVVTNTSAAEKIYTLLENYTGKQLSSSSKSSTQTQAKVADSNDEVDKSLEELVKSLSDLAKG